MASRQKSISVEEFRAMTGHGRPRPKRERSALEVELERQIAARGLPTPETEFRFMTDRRFRFDFAWKPKKLAVEVEGGIYSNGRHVRGAAYEEDLKKYNFAAKQGWTLLRFGPTAVNDGSAVLQIEAALANTSEILSSSEARRAAREEMEP